MNVVIFGKGFGKPRQMNLSGRLAGALLALIAACLGSAMFGVGYWYSAQTGSGVSQFEVATISKELVAQKNQIQETRQETEDTLDALAISIGQMNARIIRFPGHRQPNQVS